MTIIPKLIYSFNAFPIKISGKSFVDIGKLILNFIWKRIGNRTAKTFFKKNKVGGIILPDVKAFYIPIVITIAWYWWTDRHRHQWNRTETQKQTLEYIRPADF